MSTSLSIDSTLIVTQLQDIGVLEYKETLTKSFFAVMVLIAMVLSQASIEQEAIRDVYPTVEMYDPATDRWTKKADAPLPRKVHRACVLNDLIYVFGGRNVIGGWPQSTLFKYDPAVDTWTAREDMPYEVATAPASTVDGRIYLNWWLLNLASQPGYLNRVGIFPPPLT